MKWATCFKDALPDSKTDIDWFVNKASELIASGYTGQNRMHNPATGSHMYYDFDNNKPMFYQPYINAIFTNTLDIKDANGANT